MSCSAPSSARCRTAAGCSSRLGLGRIGRLHIVQEHLRAGLPAIAHGAFAGLGGSILSAASAASRKSSETTPPMPSPTMSIGPGHRIGGHRRAAGQRLDDDIAEGVGAAREDEDVGRGVDLGQFVAWPAAEEMRFGYFAFSLSSSGPSPTITLVPGRSRSRKAGGSFPPRCGRRTGRSGREGRSRSSCRDGSD
jgi:hypothetical protein